MGVQTGQDTTILFALCAKDTELAAENLASGYTRNPKCVINCLLLPYEE